MGGCGIIGEARQKPGHPFNLIVNRGSVAAFKIVARCASRYGALRGALWRGGEAGARVSRAVPRGAKRGASGELAPGLLLNVPPHG